MVNFVKGKDKVPIDTYQTIFSDVKSSFDTKVPSNDKLREVSQKMANDDDPLELKKREGEIQSLTGNFKDTPSGQELMALLQKPIGNLRELLGADVKTQLIKAWNEQILPAAKEVEKGYPFEEGQTEADLAKLTAFLNPADGKFSVFYKDRLKKYFEESNGQLKLKSDAGISFSDDFVAYLNNAVKLQKALFGTSPTPKFEYEFTLKPVSGAIVEFTIDGQKATSDATGSIKGTFPASGTDTGVFVNSGSTSTTTSTSGSSSSNSNTSAKPPNSGDSSGAALKFPGTWGLFRFVDAGRPQKQPGGEYSLSYSIGGKSVSATIKTSGGDLFDKNIFKSLRAPQAFLK